MVHGPRLGLDHGEVRLGHDVDGGGRVGFPPGCGEVVVTVATFLSVVPPGTDRSTSALTTMSDGTRIPSTTTTELSTLPQPRNPNCAGSR